jgi:hypothetical protein
VDAAIQLMEIHNQEEAMASGEVEWLVDVVVDEAVVEADSVQQEHMLRQTSMKNVNISQSSSPPWKVKSTIYAQGWNN